MELSFRNVANRNVVHRKSNPRACHDDLLLLASRDEKIRKNVGPIIGMTPRESRVFAGLFVRFLYDATGAARDRAVY
jgi:hypothetical protein